MQFEHTAVTALFRGGQTSWQVVTRSREFLIRRKRDRKMWFQNARFCQSDFDPPLNIPTAAVATIPWHLRPLHWQRTGIRSLDVRWSRSRGCHQRIPWNQLVHWEYANGGILPPMEDADILCYVMYGAKPLNNSNFGTAQKWWRKKIYICHVKSTFKQQHWDLYCNVMKTEIEWYTGKISNFLSKYPPVWAVLTNGVYFLLQSKVNIHWLSPALLPRSGLQLEEIHIPPPCTSCSLWLLI